MLKLHLVKAIYIKRSVFGERYNKNVNNIVTSVFNILPEYNYMSHEVVLNKTGI